MRNRTNEEDREYPVEKIVKKRIVSNNVELFKIRWLGYSWKDDWWMSEEDCLPACYDLVKKYEKSHFEKKRMKNMIPKVISSREVQNELKLLIQWSDTRSQFYYSSVVMSFYEKRITPIRQLDNEWKHFLNTRVINAQLLDNAFPHKIIAVARSGEEVLCLVQWRQNQEEANVVKLEFMKEKYPKFLIEFYERHMVPRA